MYELYALLYDSTLHFRVVLVLCQNLVTYYVHSTCYHVHSTCYQSMHPIQYFSCDLYVFIGRLVTYFVDI
jgi:hypothetical protein